MRACTTGARIAIHEIREVEFLSTSIRGQMSTFGFTSATDADIAVRGFERDLSARTAGHWIVELRRAGYCRNVPQMAPWADYISGTFALTPRLSDPADLGERALRAQVLLDALDAPDLDIEPLFVVDWAMRPALRAFNDAALDLTAGGNSTLDAAYSRFDLSQTHWPTIREARRALLGPWFGGHFRVHDHEVFTLLHDRLPDELAYVLAQVAGGQHYAFDPSTRPDIGAISDALLAEKLIRVINAVPGRTIIARSRRVASRLDLGEVLDIA